MKTYINVHLLLLSIILLFLIYVGSIFIGFQIVALDSVKVLSLISLLLFLATLVFSLKNDANFFLLLPFVILAFPAPVNDFFPGYPLGIPSENGYSVFPFITHIDIFILINLTKKLAFGHRIRLKQSKLVLIALFMLIVSYTVNAFSSRDEIDLFLLLTGSFQLRYILVMYLCLSVFDHTKHETELFYGIVIAILFLFVEASFNTYIKGTERLSSGSLGMNSFGNVIGALAIVLIFIKGKFTKIRHLKFLRIIGIFFCILIIIKTGNRMSILALLASILFLKSYIFGSFRKFIWFTILGVSLLSAAYISVINHLPERYNLVSLFDKIHFSEMSFDPDKVLSIESSRETSGLITRIQLFTVSVKMIQENPWFGIGVGRWNNWKYRYGFKGEVLIDSHNGYLSIISQYGICGLILIWFIYFYSISSLRRINKNTDHINLFSILGMVNIFFIFADLTNSGVFKHQIFAFLVFTAMVSRFELDRKRD